MKLVLIMTLIFYIGTGMRIAKTYIDTMYDYEEDGNVYWTWLKCVVFGIPIWLLWVYTVYTDKRK